MSGAPHRAVVRAPGKINLSLAVGAVDERGYHELATVFHAVHLFETVTAVAADELSLTIDSEVPGDIPTDGTNLALKAARLLQERAGIERGAALHIHKQVPVAGGMGGGSADAAATLVALNHLWELGIPPERLRALGGLLGADVPFAMLGRTALGRGTGTELTRILTDGDWYWLLAVPGGHLSTPAVYRRHDELAAARGRELPRVPQIDPRQIEALASGDLELLGRTLRNDLQTAACALHPGLEPVLETSLGAGVWGAMVSGSGPTIAVLVGDEAKGLTLTEDLMDLGRVEQCHLVKGSAPGATVLELA
ncbi:4-(cytidine 5'-diphospho)-2-C-methyl-D-erythritol kinase [Brachybacterium sp. DNPG3]